MPEERIRQAVRPTFERFIDIVRRTTPASYHELLIDPTNPESAFYRQFARVFATLAEQADAAAQRAFFLPNTLQREPPATSALRSRFEAIVRRTADLDQPRFVQAGSMVIQGPRERLYTNTVDVEWIEFDTEPAKTVPFESTVLGDAGNLPWLADENGNITRPPEGTEVWTEKIDLRELAFGRTGQQAQIFPGSIDTPSVLQDNGRAPVLQATDVGLYLRILDSQQAPENVGRVLRIVGFEEPNVEEPPFSGLFPRRVLLDDGPLRTKLSSAQADDGGVFTDETVAANESSPDDMTLLPAVASVGDAYYFGAELPARSFALSVSQAGEGDWTLAWEYWNGVAFVPLAGLSDLTTGFRVLGQSQISYTLPSDWAQLAVNGVSAFYIRARVVSVTTTTVQPLGAFSFANVQIKLSEDSISAPSDVGTVTWQILDWRGLGFVLDQVQAPNGGKDNDLRLLADSRGVKQQDGETDEDFRQRASRLPEVVTPRAIRNAVDGILEPFGLEGTAIDVQLPGGFTGLFYDVPVSSAPDVVAAYDLYGPGDNFPVDPYLLPLALQESRWHFFVVVPRSSLGEFGSAYDQGPQIFLDPPGEFLDSAYESAFFDGFAVTADQIYTRISNALDPLRGGGISFTLIFGDVQKCP